MLTLATKITLLRVLLVPLVVVLLYFESRTTCIIAAAAFAVAGITDWMDGYVARHQHMVTNMGKFLDPLADKLLICAVLIMLVDKGWAPAWVVIIIVCRELIITGLRTIAIDEGIVMAADRYGKLKTVLPANPDLQNAFLSSFVLLCGAAARTILGFMLSNLLKSL